MEGIINNFTVSGDSGVKITKFTGIRVDAAIPNILFVLVVGKVYTSVNPRDGYLIQIPGKTIGANNGTPGDSSYLMMINEDSIVSTSSVGAQIHNDPSWFVFSNV